MLVSEILKGDQHGHYLSRKESFQADVECDCRSRRRQSCRTVVRQTLEGLEDRPVYSGLEEGRLVYSRLQGSDSDLPDSLLANPSVAVGRPLDRLQHAAACLVHGLVPSRSHRVVRAGTLAPRSAYLVHGISSLGGKHGPKSHHRYHCRPGGRVSHPCDVTSDPPPFIWPERNLTAFSFTSYIFLIYLL